MLEAAAGRGGRRDVGARFRAGGGTNWCCHSYSSHAPAPGGRAAGGTQKMVAIRSQKSWCLEDAAHHGRRRGRRGVHQHHASLAGAAAAGAAPPVARRQEEGASPEQQPPQQQAAAGSTHQAAAAKCA